MALFNNIECIIVLILNVLLYIYYMYYLMYVQYYIKYYDLCHSNYPLEKIQLSVNCYLSLSSVFIHQNDTSTTVFYVYSILEERPKALLKMFIIAEDRLMLPIRSQDIIFQHIFENAFLYRCFPNIDYR